MEQEQLELLQEFVDLCRIKPSVLQMEELQFFRDWLIELGATIPKDKRSKHNSRSSNDEHVDDKPVEHEQLSEESDLEISTDGVIGCDEVVYDQFMGDQTIQVTEEMEDLSDEKRNEALSQFKEGNFDEAIKLFTEAIKINPTCAMLYAKRASCYVKMRCPNAAIKDCNKSFELNPDSALAYKWRGISHKLLGNWEESYSDLTQSLKLDYADDTYEQMKDVESKAKMIREHKRKYERKREDKLLNEKREKIRRAQEANEKAKKSNEAEHDFGDIGGKFKGTGSGMPGSMPGGMPGGISDFLNDPELVEDLKDPEVMAAFSEIMSNPGSLLKHQSNPKISKIMKKMQSKFASGAGHPTSSPDKEKPAGSKSHTHHPKMNTADDLD